MARFWLLLLVRTWSPGLTEEVTPAIQQKLEDLIAQHRSGSNDALAPPPRHMHRQNWGEAFEQVGPGRGDSPSLDSELAALWGQDGISGTVAAMKTLPMQISSKLADIIFESRLGKVGQTIDYSIKIHPEDFAAFSVHGLVRDLALESRQWRLVQNFSAAAAASSLQAHQELWLEVDQASPTAPSVFVGPSSWVRDLLMAAPVGELFGVDSKSVSAVAAAKLLDPLLQEIWSPFWSSMPWLDRTQDAVRRQLVDLILRCGEQTSIYQLGFWLARDTFKIRAVLEAERIYDEPGLHGDGGAWWAATRADLEGVGWRWSDQERPNLLDEVMPQLLVGISHFFVALEVGESGIASKIGFEMYFSQEIFDDAIQEHGPENVPKTHAHMELFLDALVHLGLCTQRDRQAILALYVQDGGIKPVARRAEANVGAFEFLVHTRVNHIKVGFAPGTPTQAKLYVASSWKWLNQDVVQRAGDREGDRLNEEL